MSHSELHTINRAFRAAMHRLAAPDHYPGAKADELSNALHHLHRLGELGRRVHPLHGDRPIAVGAPGALGAQWVRLYDTHQIAHLAFAGTQARRYPRSYGLVWREVTDMTFVVPDAAGHHLDYVAHLAGEDVVQTLAEAFEGLERIVAGVD